MTLTTILHDFHASLGSLACSLTFSSPLRSSRSYLLAIFLEYPKTLMKFHIYTGILDKATGNREPEEPSMWDMPTSEVVLFCITVGTATLLVHGVHLKAVLTVGYNYVNSWFFGGEEVKVRTSTSASASASAPMKASESSLEVKGGEANVV